MWLGRLPVLEPRLDFRIAELDVEPALRDIESDRVAVAKRRDRSTDESFRRDMTRHQSMRRARKAPIGHQRYRFTKSLSHHPRRHAAHFRHPAPSAPTPPP